MAATSENSSTQKQLLTHHSCVSADVHPPRLCAGGSERKESFFSSKPWHGINEHSRKAVDTIPMVRTVTLMFIGWTITQESALKEGGSLHLSKTGRKSM